MMQEPAGVSTHSFLTLPPFGTAILEPNLWKAKEEGNFGVTNMYVLRGGVDIILEQ